MIVFNDIIADMTNNEKLHPVATELSIRNRKLDTSFVLITQSYFKVGCKTKHHTLLHQEDSEQTRSSKIVTNHSFDIDFKDFMHLYRKFAAKPYSFFITDTTLPSDNLSLFRKNLFEEL